MNFMKQLPSFYYGSTQVRNIQAAIGIEAEELRAAISDLLDQVFISSATWGLRNWEIYLGLDTNPEESYENRRSRIMSRLRGQGTTTKEMLKNVCQSFSGGEVEIIERYSEYAFVIKFVGTLGRPANLGYLAGAIEEIKPAHLGYSFEFTYNTHEDLGVYTHEYMGAYTHEKLREMRGNHA